MYLYEFLFYFFDLLKYAVLMMSANEILLKMLTFFIIVLECRRYMR